jgi:tRNA uridine 5-carboxymethylaminomethyl modification enzyme
MPASFGGVRADSCDLFDESAGRNFYLGPRAIVTPGCHGHSRSAQLFHVELVVFAYPKTYDVVVVGAGHAGIEAASAAARLVQNTSPHTKPRFRGTDVVQPSHRRSGQGQMVREIDALGGIMALNTDATAIQVECSIGERAQRPFSARAMRQKAVNSVRKPFENLRDRFKKGDAIRVLVEGQKACGVQTGLGPRVSRRGSRHHDRHVHARFAHVGRRSKPAGEWAKAFPR